MRGGRRFETEVSEGHAMELVPHAVIAIHEWENGEDLDLKRPVPACILTVSRVAGDIDTDTSSGDSDPETADVRSPIQMPVGGAPKRRPVRSRV